MVTKPFEITGAWGGLGGGGIEGVGVWGEGSSEMLAHTLSGGQSFMGSCSPTLHTRKLGLRRKEGRPTDAKPGSGEMGFEPVFLRSGPHALCFGDSVSLSQPEKLRLRGVVPTA